jgi:hypothetical protein
VHHKNLVALDVYCSEHKEQLLIYIHMPGGTVHESLYGKTWKTLKWWFNAKPACTIVLNMNVLYY